MYNRNALTYITNKWNMGIFLVFAFDQYTVDVTIITPLLLNLKVMMFLTYNLSLFIK